MKKFLIGLLLLACMGFTPADLKGGTVVAVGKCIRFGGEYDCAFVEKDGNYIVLFDKTGAKYVYKVPMFKVHLEEEEMELVWQRFDT